MTKKFVASFSAIQAYETCPRKYYEERVTRRYEQPKGEAAIWGDEVHKKIENSIKTGEPMPSPMARYQPVVDIIHNTTGDLYPEIKLAITADLKPCDFFSPQAWLRGICDLLIVRDHMGAAFDWKTGKKKKESSQLDVMASLAFLHFPKIEYIHTAFVWLQEMDMTKVEPRFVAREDVPELMEGFRSRVSDIEYSYEHNIWPERQSGLCKQWCPVKECVHNGGYRRKS